MYRGRRLRKSSTILNMVSETTLQVSDFIYPLFIKEGKNKKEEISSMPGVYQFTIDRLDEVLYEMDKYKLYTCILFGVVSDKDMYASKAYDPNGIIQQAIRKIKKEYPHFCVIADVCMCEYTNHGHCGIIDNQGVVDNDMTLPYLQKIALSYANCGVDMVAPSSMMDGQVQAIRTILDQHKFYDIPIMSYSVKYASNFYGPFRYAADSTPSFGNRSSYQMDYRNRKEAYQEAKADIEETADVVIVKPASLYLDIIYQIATNFHTKVVGYQVSGEYTMLKSAIQNHYLNKEVMYESLIAIKRAGADFIISYEALNFAKEFYEGDLYGTRSK